MEYGFENYYEEDIKVNKINLEDKNKINILITHGSLNSSKMQEKQYNPISEKELEKIGFDYVALGHIHETNYIENKKIVYPSSTISLGFDEIGKHGMIVGNIEKNNLKIEFINLDERKFEEINLEISEINSQEELIEKINEIKIDENTWTKIILTGKRNFEINKNIVFNLIKNKNILKIKDETKLNYNLEEISKEQSLKGIFVKEMLELMENEEYTKDEIEKAILIGLEAF